MPGQVERLGRLVAVLLLFSFRTPATPALGTLAGAGVAIVGSAGASAAATDPPATASGTPPPTAAAPRATSTPAPTKGGSGQFTGQVEQTPFGPVQVRITISAGRLTEVQAVQLPSDHFRSQMIAQYAAPILRQEALQAQSAQIDLVSGATYTSEGYAQSLQSALDQAHA